MKRRIPALFLALCIAISLLVPVSAAEGSARDAAQSYRSILNSTTLRARVAKPVLFYDLTGDGAPEMLLTVQSRSGTELQIWTYQNGGAAKALSLDWVEVSASRHWLYLLKNGGLGWYYTNSGYDYPYASIFHQGRRYAWNGSAFAQTDAFEYNYREGNGTVTPTSATHNGTRVSTSEGAALDRALQAGAARTLMILGDGAPNGMTKAEALAYLGSITGRFFDVPAGRFYTDPVAWAVENDITAGTSTYLFSPDDPCTRAQAVTFLWRAAGKPEPRSRKTGFTDVPAGTFYSKAVAWAVECGVTTGTSAATFSPNRPCTRGQIVTFLWRAAGSPKTSGTNQFSDVPAKSYCAAAVRWAVSTGVTKGLTATRFGPDEPCTRGQIVTFLYRVWQKGIELRPDSWSDAYKSFVLNQSFLNGAQEYRYEAGFFLVRLYDLDRDGTPELIIDNGGSGRSVRWAYIYTFSGGQVRYLDIGPSETYRDPANPVGIYGRYSISPDENWTKYVKSGSSIQTSAAGTFPMFTGHTDFQGLPSKTVEEIRNMGWEAFLDTQLIA